MSLDRVQILEKCVPNLNEKYTGQRNEKYALNLNVRLTTTRVIHDSDKYIHAFDVVMLEV